MKNSKIKGVIFDLDNTLLDFMQMKQFAVDMLEEYAKTAVSRLRETESIAAHVLAIEALLVVILRQMPISKADLISEVKKLQPKDNSNGQQTSLVESIASDIFEKSNNF